MRYSWAVYLTLALFSLPGGVEAQRRTIGEVLLNSDGLAHFGDEDYNDLPFHVRFTMDEIPEGSRQLVLLGPLEIRLEGGQIESRLTQSDSGVSFISLPAEAGAEIRADIGTNSHILAVGSSATLKAGFEPAPDIGQFTLGAGGGPQLRVRDFESLGARVFRDGFESGDTDGWDGTVTDLEEVEEDPLPPPGTCPPDPCP